MVSGAAAKQRPLHTPFLAYQDRAYPQKKTVFAQGQVWGFASLSLGRDAGEITLLTIPDTGAATPQEAITHRFQRRSG